MSLTMPQASQVSNVPAGNVAATDVQGAINELDAEKVALATKDATGGYAGLTALKINFKNALSTFTSFLLIRILRQGHIRFRIGMELLQMRPM